MNEGRGAILAEVGRNVPAFEKLLTIGQAAEALGVHLWQLRRAVKRGDIPSYAPFNSRRLVRLTEVLTFIEASRDGRTG